MSTEVKLVGRLTADPEIKFGQSGKAWTRFTVVTNRRFLNKDTNAWEEKDTTFWNCVAFGKLAENMADSLTKGDRVIVHGHAKEESYTGQDNTPRKEMRVTAEEVAASLLFGPTKAGNPATRPQTPPPPADDPWASATSGIPF